MAHGLLISVASLAAELRLLGSQASVVLAHGLSCAAACGTFLDQGSNLCPLHWPLGQLPGTPGNPCANLMFSFLVGKCRGVELLGHGVCYMFSFVESLTLTLAPPPPSEALPSFLSPAPPGLNPAH